jgi:predicted PurR-regulated permease PerM
MCVVVGVDHSVFVRDEAPKEDGTFVRRVLIATGVVVAIGMVLWLLHLAGHGMLIVLAGIVIAVLIDGLVRRSPLPRIPSLVVLAVVTLGLLGALSWWMGAALYDQLEGVQERAREAWPRVQAWLNARPWGAKSLEELSKFQWTEQAGGRFGEVLFAAFGGIATLLLVPVFGIFFAVSPKLYVESIVHLFPLDRRPRVREVAGEVGRALRSWFIGRFISMTVVGIGTTLGLWAAGVPMPIALGLIAGLLSFVPNVGPPIAAIPGVLVGLSVSPTTALWAVGVYVGVQAVDNYIVTPFVDQRAVDVPPAAQLGMQLLLGLAAGAIGVFLATPLMIMIVVMVQAFYVQDVLLDPVSLLGQNGKGKRKRGWFGRKREAPRTGMPGHVGASLP